MQNYLQVLTITCPSTQAEENYSFPQAVFYLKISTPQKKAG